ncbi:hypothetical protein [Cytobacillus sp. FSL R7-0680]|uniref:hypothetical protein n=1 Tax=Cytobacillus sp. FSL R7-0680 TaxID=2921689 RepID=UPI0030F7E948
MKKGFLSVLLLMGCGAEEIKETEKSSEEIVTDVSKVDNEKEAKYIKPDTKTVEGNNDEGEDIIAFHWHNIEALPKAENFTEAVETIFGKDRYYYDYTAETIEKMIDVYKANDDKQVVTVKNGDDDKPISFVGGFIFDLSIDLDVDPRMEMIDFLHYLKMSDLIKSDSDTFSYAIRLYNKREPGMNYSEPAMLWSIKGKAIAEMDFNDKTSIYKSIYQYGKYEGMYPTE